MNKKVYCEDCIYCHWDGGWCATSNQKDYINNYGCRAPENYILVDIPAISPNPIPTCDQIGTPRTLNAENACSWFKKKKSAAKKK
jgi:hypothetical protein